MPTPTRRHSVTRTRKRRTHDALKAPLLIKCPVTNVLHKPHVAYWVDEDLYYKGQKVMSRSRVSEDDDQE